MALRERVEVETQNSMLIHPGITMVKLVEEDHQEYPRSPLHPHRLEQFRHQTLNMNRAITFHL